MATYVLVHGAWSGSHVFRPVRALLRAAGHEVVTPCLTGLGERSHLASPQVDLTTHITDVVNVIRYEDLHDIVLLGFSYGGFVVTGTLRHIGDRVAHLVYLDAFVPGNGQTLADVTGRGGDRIPGLGESWLVPPPARVFEDPAEGAFQAARRVAHPGGCFTEPVRLDKALEDYPFTRTYVKATADPGEAAGASPFWLAAARAKSSPAWQYHEVDTNHLIPVNRPAELAELLLALG